MGPFEQNQVSLRFSRSPHRKIRLKLLADCTLEGKVNRTLGEEFGRAETPSSPKSPSIRQTGTCNRMGVVSRRISRVQYEWAGYATR